MTHRSRAPSPTARTGLRSGDRALVIVLGVTALALVVIGAAVPNQPWFPALADPDSQVRLFFDPTSEANLWTWFNVVLLAAAAAAHAVTGWLRRRAGEAAAGWFVVAAFLAVLSLDDLASLHERLDAVGRALGAGEGALRAAWVVPALAVAAPFGIAVWRVARRALWTVRSLLLTGMGLFLGAALGLELVAFAVLDLVGSGPLYAGLSYLEELLEAWGVVLVLAAAPASWTLRTRGDDVVLGLRGTAPQTG